MSNTAPFRLITFPKPKYGEQIVAVEKGFGGGFNLALFDAVSIFMTTDSWSERVALADEAEAWAKQFVAQMNAGADALESQKGDKS